MRTDKINGKTVILYDSSTNIPIRNYQGYNSNFVIDMGIGSDTESIARHYKELHDLVSREKTTEALQVINNYYQCLTFIKDSHSPKYLAFQNLVHSIDGQEPTQYLLDQLNPTNGYIDDILNWFKKKLNLKSMLFFKKRVAKT